MYRKFNINLLIALFFILFIPQKLFAEYKLGVHLEEMCFENGYGFAYTKERSSIACKPYGVIINKFANPSLAKDIGVKQMDVIVEFDGKATKTMNSFVKQFSSTKNEVDHEMIIHRWNNSLNKMEPFKVSFKVQGNIKKKEKKTVKNLKSNEESKLKNQKTNIEEAYIAANNLIVRDNPNGKKIGSLPFNNKVEIYDRNKDKTWSLIKSKKPYLLGWVSSKYLSKNILTKDNIKQNLEIAKNNDKKNKTIKTETKKEKPKEKLYIGSHLVTLFNSKIITFNNGDTFTPKSKDNLPYTFKDIGDNKKEIIINGEGTFKFKNGDFYVGQIKDTKMDGIGMYKYGKYNEFTYTGNFVNGLKSGLGKLEFNANVYNQSASYEIAAIQAKKNEELTLSIIQLQKDEISLEKLEIEKKSFQTEIKNNLKKCESINRKIADDFDFDISNWDNNNCNQFKLLKCERLCYHKTGSFDSCNNCHKQVGVFPTEDASINSRIESLKNELIKKENLINELQNSQANLNFKEKVSFSIKSTWNNDELDLSKPVKITFDEINKYYNGFINNNYEPNGTGELVFGKKVIKGEWVNGFIDKQATIKFPNNNTVIGPLNINYSERLLTLENFNVEKFNITNQDYKINFSNGDVYSGTVKIKSENLNTSKYPFLLHGFGKITYKSGDQYEGEWINDLKSGLGEYQSKDGDLYNGQWKEDKKHNQGTMVYKNGEKYEGEWKENKRDGSGTLFDSKNIIIQRGLYKDDDFLEGYNDNKYVYANGNIYDGELDDYLPYGYGIVLNKEGKLISKGKFQKNEKTGLFIEFLANQYKLIDYDYANGKEKEIITNIEILEICRPETKKNDDCYGKTKINFLNEKNLNGTFIGVFNDNHPSNGIIKFGKNEKRLDYFSGNILEDKHGYKYDGQLFYIDDNFYFEGVYAILFPEKNKNYQFLGTRYNRENGNERKWKLIDEISIKEEFINNYSFERNGKITFKNNFNAFEIYNKKCLKKFYERDIFRKDFKDIKDFKDVDELKKKREYYTGFYEKLINEKRDFMWNASFELSGLKNCYTIPYDEIIDIKSKKELSSGTYKIKLISKDFIVLSNGYVIQRFEDELTSLNEEFVNIDKKFGKEVTKESLQKYKYALLDFAYTYYPQEILDYNSNLKEIKKIENSSLIASKDLKKIKDDNSLEKDVKKEKIKKIKSVIKENKNLIKNLKKNLKKNFDWNNFDIITKELQLKVIDINDFHYEELRKHGDVQLVIYEWEDQLEDYKNKQAEIKKRQAKIEQERREKEEQCAMALSWMNHYIRKNDFGMVSAYISERADLGC